MVLEVIDWQATYTLWSDTYWQIYNWVEANINVPLTLSAIGVSISVISLLLTFWSRIEEGHRQKCQRLHVLTNLHLELLPAKKHCRQIGEAIYCMTYPRLQIQNYAEDIVIIKHVLVNGREVKLPNHQYPLLVKSAGFTTLDLTPYDTSFFETLEKPKNKDLQPIAPYNSITLVTNKGLKISVPKRALKAFNATFTHQVMVSPTDASRPIVSEFEPVTV